MTICSGVLRLAFATVSLHSVSHFVELRQSKWTGRGASIALDTLPATLRPKRSRMGLVVGGDCDLAVVEEDLLRRGSGPIVLAGSAESPGLEC